MSSENFTNQFFWLRWTRPATAELHARRRHFLCQLRSAELRDSAMQDLDEGLLFVEAQTINCVQCLIE